MTLKEQYKQAQKDLTAAYTMLDMAEPNYVEVAVATVNLATARCNAIVRELKAGGATHA